MCFGIIVRDMCTHLNIPINLSDTHAHTHNFPCLYLRDVIFHSVHTLRSPLRAVTCKSTQEYRIIKKCCIHAYVRLSEFV